MLALLLLELELLPPKLKKRNGLLRPVLPLLVVALAALVLATDVEAAPGVAGVALVVVEVDEDEGN